MDDHEHSDDGDHTHHDHSDPNASDEQKETADDRDVSRVEQGILEEEGEDAEEAKQENH